MRCVNINLDVLAFVGRLQCGQPLLPVRLRLKSPHELPRLCTTETFLRCRSVEGQPRSTVPAICRTYRRFSKYGTELRYGTGE